jgi:hypothetical protein
MIIASAAGAGKSVIWSASPLISHVHELILFGSSAVIEDIRILQKSGLASLAFFYVTSGMTKRRTGVSYSHPYWSSLVNNPSPTLPFFPNSMRRIVVARNSHMQVTAN